MKQRRKADISLEANEIIKKVKELGPWAQQNNDYGVPWYECYFCGIEKSIGDKSEKHDKDCLWLEIENWVKFQK